MSNIKDKTNKSVKPEKTPADIPPLYQPVPVNRRSFLSSLATITTLIGSEIVFARFLPAGLIPVAFAQTSSPFLIP